MPEERSQDETTPVHMHLHRLRSIMKNIALLTNLICGLSLLNAAGAGFLWASPLERLLPATIGIVSGASIGCGVAALILLFAYERLVGLGELVFEELSDELEWRLSDPYDDTRAPVESAIRERPPLSIRLVLREFVHRRGLPLVGRDSGAVPVYAAVNIALALFALNELRLSNLP